MSIRFFLVVLMLFCVIEDVNADCFSSLSPELAGRRVATISFENKSSLSDHELLSTLALQPGSLLTEELLKQSVIMLNRRGIFSNVDCQFIAQGEEVELRFLLHLFLVVREIRFAGNNIFAEAEMRRLARIYPGTRFSPTLLQATEENIRAAYRDHGYYLTKVNSSLYQEADLPLLTLTFQIDEGPAAIIGDLILEGRFPDSLEKLEHNFVKKALGRAASQKIIEDLRFDLLRLLRSQYYLESSVNVQQALFDPTTGKMKLVFQVETGEALRLEFKGNKVFSRRTLFELLNLEQRMMPFSRQSVLRFTRDVAVFYQQHGFFDARVSIEESSSDGSGIIVRLMIEEGERLPVKKVTFVGNSAFSSNELQRQIKTESEGSLFLSYWFPGYVTKEQLEADRQNIEKFYHNRGFLRATVEMHLKHEAQGLWPSFHIEEGVQQTISALQLDWEIPSGTTQLSPGVLVPGAIESYSLESSIEPNMPFDYDLIRAERLLLLEQLHQRGYPNARVRIGLKKQSGSLRYIIDAGQQVRLGRVFSAGNVLTHDNVILREMTLQPGDLWETSALQQAQRRLYRLGLFRAVSLEPGDGAIDSSEEDLAIRVTERESGNLEFAAGLNSEDGLHLVSEISQRNLGGDGDLLLFGMDGYLKSGEQVIDAGRARTVFTNPRLLDSKVEWFSELAAQLSVKLLEEYSYDRLSATTLFRLPLGERVSANAGFKFFNNNLYDVPSDMVLGKDDRGSSRLGYLVSSFDWDERNDSFNPRSGYHGVFEGRIGGSVLGGTSDLGGFSLRQSYHLPLSERLVWANNAQYRALFPFGDTKVVPLSERFFLGGRETLRGFSRNAVGPRSDEGHVVGGDHSLNASSELQLSATDSLAFAFFLDAGQSILRAKGDFKGDTNSFSSFRYSPGLGLRYKTPVGPLSLDYGFVVDREYGEGFGRLNFSIGSTF